MRQGRSGGATDQVAGDARTALKARPRQPPATLAGLGEALRRATSATGGPERPGYSLVVGAIELLLHANDEAGTIRPEVTADDFILAIADIWQIDGQGDWRSRTARLLDLIMDGLRTGVPGPG